MAQFSIEDVEIIRQKSGISYKEAIALLEYHNGSLARALVDLERNGRLKDGGSKRKERKGIRKLIHKLYRFRFVAKKENLVIVNLSVLYMLIVLFSAPYLCIIGVLLALILGFHISIVRASASFEDIRFEDIIDKAKENMDAFTSKFVDDEDSEASSATKPMSVSLSADGSVNVRDEGDGYHEADIR